MCPCLSDHYMCPCWSDHYMRPCRFDHYMCSCRCAHYMCPCWCARYMCLCQSAHYICPCYSVHYICSCQCAHYICPYQSTHFHQSAHSLAVFFTCSCQFHTAYTLISWLTTLAFVSLLLMRSLSRHMTSLILFTYWIMGWSLPVP